MPVVVAPDGINDPVDLEFRDVAGDKVIEEAQRALAGNPVLDHRRQVEHARGVPDRKVLLLRRREHVDGRVTGPGDETVVLTERPGAVMERGLQQRLTEVSRAFGRIAHRYTAFASTACAASRPFSPATPPPGCVAAPHRKRPATGVQYCAAPATGRTKKNWSSARSE